MCEPFAAEGFLVDHRSKCKSEGKSQEYVLGVVYCGTCWPRRNKTHSAAHLAIQKVAQKYLGLASPPWEDQASDHSGFVAS